MTTFFMKYEENTQKRDNANKGLPTVLNEPPNVDFMRGSHLRLIISGHRKRWIILSKNLLIGVDFIFSGHRTLRR